MPFDDQAPDAARLRRLADELAALAPPSEAAFLACGEQLARSIALFGQLDGEFTQLGARLDGTDAAGAAADLARVVDGIGRLAEGGEGHAPALARLEELGRQVTRRLAALRGIMGEVSVLALNAKVQASSIAGAESGADFAIFTREIARLAQLAGTTIDSTQRRIAVLDALVADGSRAASGLGHARAEELGAVRRTVSDGLVIMAERRRLAAEAAEAVRAAMQDGTRRVGACIAEMQINDIAGQRIDHVRIALAGLAAMLADDPMGPQLVRPVCRLQRLQLERTGALYVGQVGELIANLDGVAAAVRASLTHTRQAFAGAGAEHFASELGKGVARARALLADFTQARAATAATMRKVAEGYQAIVADLAAIESMDADMRVIGLNATLRCGRLGSRGRALAVIAQELRSCSTRTGENARAIASLLGDAIATADSLAAAEDGQEVAALGALSSDLDRSQQELHDLAGALSDALACLGTDGGALVAMLEATARGITIHRQVGDALARIAGALAGQPGEAESDDTPEAVRDVIKRMLEGQYTMASERLVHDLFDGEDGGQDGAGNAGNDPGEPGIDDLLF